MAAVRLCAYMHLPHEDWWHQGEGRPALLEHAASELRHDLDFMQLHSALFPAQLAPEDARFLRRFTLSLGTVAMGTIAISIAVHTMLGR